MNHYSLPGAIVLCLLCLLSQPKTATAQCDTNQFVAPGLLEYGTGTPTYTTNISVYYQFEIPYDSGRTLYTISEFKKNGQRLKLDGWCNGNTIKGEVQGVLASKSNTSCFTVATGDTLTFYRELMWRNPQDSIYRNYYAKDTLSFSVDLIDSSSGARVVLLDSIGILRQIPSGSPSLHGSLPILAIVQYVVPSGLNGSTVFMRVHPYAKGDGDYYFMRTDLVTGNLSATLSDSVWLNRVDVYGGGLGKRTIRTEDVALNNASIINIIPNPTRGSSTIEFSGNTLKGKPIALAIYDMTGHLLFMPFFTGSFTGNGKVQYNFKKSGDYLVVLQQGRNTLKVSKVTVVK